ncbi:MAG: hypothetical protein ACRCZ2_04230 [Fusobacteriaceae bacterium]
MINTYDQLEELRDTLSEVDFSEYESLICASESEEVNTPQWYTTKDMQNKILKKYNLESNDPYGVGSEDDNN